MPLGREGWLVEGATFKQILELNKDNKDGWGEGGTKLSFLYW